MRRIAWRGATLVLLYPTLAIAQETPAPTGDVVVEARKRPEPIDDVPASVQVVTARQIAQDHVRSLDDLGELLPNTLLNRRQDNEPNVTMRGVGGFGNVQGVGFYLDGVQNFTDQSARIEDVERIEVLKGPQGTLYGGNSLGGAIDYILKQPGDRLAAEGRVGYGSFDSLDLFGAVDLPLADGLAARVSAYAHRTDGYVANTTLGGWADRAYEDGGRLAVVWSPAPDARLTLELRHDVLEDGGNIYVRVPDATAYRRDVDYNEPAFNDRVVTGGSLKGEFQAGDTTVTWLGSYTRRSNRFLWDLDYSAADAVTLLNGPRHATQVVTQEVRAASPGERLFTWQVGAYYADVTDRDLTIDADVLLGRDAGGPLLIRNYSNGTTDDQQYAAFGTLGFNPGRWRFELGARLNRTQFVGRVLGDPVTRTEVDGTALLPRASVGYQLGGTLLYANVAAGTEPGRVNVASPTGSAYRAERALSSEAGIKGAILGGRFRYSAAAFYVDDRHRQFETLFANAAGVLVEETTNIGRSVSYGAEATLAAALTPRLTLNAAAGWLHARWADPAARFDLNPIDGLRVPDAPSATAHLGATYRQPIGDALQLRLETDTAFNSGFYWDVPNTSRQPSYAILNAGIAVEPRDGGRWSVSARIMNATDTHYYTEFNPNLFGPGQSLGAPGRPRTVTITLAIRG